MVTMSAATCGNIEHGKRFEPRAVSFRFKVGFRPGGLQEGRPGLISLPFCALLAVNGKSWLCGQNCRARSITPGDPLFDESSTLRMYWLRLQSSSSWLSCWSLRVRRFWRFAGLPLEN